MLNPTSFLFIVLLGLIFACGSLGTDIFAPAQPSIASQLRASDFQAQLIMSMYYSGLAIAQLVFGPLSDRFGRKPILRFGLWLFAASTLAGAFAPSIDFLIGTRFVQGFAASSGLVIARAIARDHFEGPSLGRTMSYLALTLSLSPVLLPPLGGLLTGSFGWPSTFLTLSVIIAAIAIWMEFSMSESMSMPILDALTPRAYLARFGKVLKNARFIGYMITGSLCFAGLFAYISVSSLVFRDYFGAPAEEFGVLLGLAFIGHSIGAFVGGRLATHLGSDKLIFFGAIICFASGLAMFFLNVIGVTSIANMSFLMAIYLFGAGWVYPQSLACALHPFPKMAGAASAMMGFAVMMTSSLTSAAVGALYDGTPATLTSFIALVSALSLGFYAVFVRSGLLSSTETAK